MANNQELAQVGNHLIERRPQILKEWERRVERDPLLDPKQMSQKDFLDHIPEIIEELAQLLRTCDPCDGSMPERVGADFRKHGVDRWQQGFRLSQLVRDWHHLSASVQVVLDRDAGKGRIPVDNRFFDAQIVLSEYISTGVNSSICAYERLRSAESDRIVKDLKHALDELQKATSEKSENMLGAAHDLRGTIQVMVNLSRLIASDTSDKSKELAATLVRGLQTSYFALDEMMTYYRLESDEQPLSLSDFDASSLFNSMRDYCQPLAKQRELEIICEGPEKFDVHCDQVKLTRVVQNLLLNSIKYSKEGKILLKWGRLDEEKWEVQIEECREVPHRRKDDTLTDFLLAARKRVDKRARGEAKLDTASPQDKGVSGAGHGGPVPSPEDAQQVLESHGEGIGLFIVRRLTGLLCGKLEIHRKPEGGLFAAVSLPLKRRTEDSDSRN